MGESPAPDSAIVRIVPGPQLAPWMTNVVSGSPKGWSDSTAGGPGGNGGNEDGGGPGGVGRELGDRAAGDEPCALGAPLSPDMPKPVSTAPRAAPATSSATAAVARTGRLSAATCGSRPRSRAGPGPGPGPGPGGMLARQSSWRPAPSSGRSGPAGTGVAGRASSEA
jgi:hypothetical protein